jgi:hypothetical protein
MKRWENIQCDNLIPGLGMLVAWALSQGKLMYQSTFGHVPTCVYMSYRPNEQFASVRVRGMLLAGQ